MTGTGLTIVTRAINRIAGWCVIRILGRRAMLKTDRDKRICARYSKRYRGCVNCGECPLSLARIHPEVVGLYDLMCKANSHYDRHLREWVPDEEGEE